MCGIGGIIDSSSPGLAAKNVLGHIQRSLRHRGPDDEGHYISPSGEAGLVHARLSILDLSAAGHQPMATPDGRYTICFNGEVYNFRELREELAREGMVFRSDSDTEVILRLYERFGPACVERLRGMFAFAIWDERERTCFLTRDALGIKPLYYHLCGRRMVFASELRALLAAGLVSRKLNANACLGFFKAGSVQEPETLVEGVLMLPAGHSLLWREGQSHLTRFWQCRFGSEPCSKESAVRRVREALLDSVGRHFISDVPVGIFLSGGIDSTALLALARAGGQQDVRTFSISVENPAMNEGDVARRTAGHFLTRHSELRLDSELGRSLFGEFLKRLDQPSIDGFNTYSVSKFARDQGMKVVLSGLGGDELFGGYPSFATIPRMVRGSRKLGILGPLRRVLGQQLERRSERPQLRRLGGFLCQEATVDAAYGAYRSIYSLNEARDLAAYFAGCEAVALRGPRREHVEQPTMEDEVSALELTCYMRNQLLRDSDVMSMACGLELRVPFVDRSLVEAVAGIPAALRLQAGKQLLLDAVPEVPEWVANRPKRGFVFPFEEWLSGDWKEMFEASSARSPVRAQTWYQKWSLFVFEHWCEELEISRA